MCLAMFWFYFHGNPWGRCFLIILLMWKYPREPKKLVQTIQLVSGKVGTWTQIYMIAILCYKTKGYIAFSCQTFFADCFISAKLLNTFPIPQKTVRSFEFSFYSFLLPHQRQFTAKFLLILPLNIWFSCLPFSIFTSTILLRSFFLSAGPFQ